jgi:hypothetical protein
VATVISFTPSLALGQVPFSFQATFDGALYNCSVTWSLAGQRWYVDIVDQNGVLVAHLPMVGSSSTIPLESLTWSIDNGGQVTAITEEPHGFTLGLVVVLTIQGATPTGYNAITPCYVTGPSTLVYPLSVNPGANVQPGAYSSDINLVKGYFVQNTLVWRIQDGNIIVGP